MQLNLDMTHDALTPANTLPMHHEPAYGTAPGSLTELIVPSTLDSLNLLLPMLSHTSHTPDHRWISIIDSPALSKDALTRYGANTKRFQRIYHKANSSYFQLLYNMIRSGTSKMIIAQHKQLTRHQLQVLEATACACGTQCLLLRAR